MLTAKEEIKPQESRPGHKIKRERIASIDIFRGITIFTMILVNDLAGVSNIPWWMKHMPPDQSGMTFVDLVFPAFLFIVGMAIPFSINKRISEGDSAITILKRILIRSAGLLVLGILMVNMGGLNSEASGINKQLWIILVFMSVIAVWNSYPNKTGKSKYLISSLRTAGIIALIVLAFIYRGGTGENIHWLKTSWWGILGLIGWAYLAASVLYLIFRTCPSVLTALMFLFPMVYIAEKTDLFAGIYAVNNSLLIGMQVSSHASITISGILLSYIITSSKFSLLRKKITAMLFYSLLLLSAGILLNPLYGINKNLATPAWCFYSAFLCVIIFMIIYLVVDYKKYIKWSSFLTPAGVNPLLAYILPSIFYAFITLSGLSFYSELGDGIIGITRSLLFTLFILFITQVLTKLNIKLHL